MARAKALDQLGIGGQQLVPDDHPRPRQWSHVIDRQQADVHAARLEAQRLVVSEAGDEVDVTVRQAVDLVELRVLADRDVVLGQAAGIEQGKERVPRRAEATRRADRHPCQPGRIGRHRRRIPDERHGKALVQGRDVPDRDPGRASDHDVGRIGHAELGLAVGDQALDVGRLGVLDRDVQARIGVEALLLRDVERRELHVGPEAEQQPDLAQLRGRLARFWSRSLARHQDEGEEQGAGAGR